jgi:Na+-exporting ATPase
MEQVFNSMTLVLLLAFGASSGIQAWIEGGIIVFNIILCFMQTLKAERTIESLKTLGNPEASVLREGRVITVPTSEIVRSSILDFHQHESGSRRRDDRC